MKVSAGALPVTYLSLLACFFSLLSMEVSAQLCTGSLGDPVVNITFGRGPSPGPALGSTVTNYNYITGDCPNDGQYTIRNSTNNCYNTWHTLPADHTGNGQGYFMMANASFAPSDFFVQKVSGICANTTYEFAAWVINLVRISGQIKPNITFSIEQLDGTVLGSFSSGDINNTSTPQWRQYGFNFTTPPGTFEVIIRMRNNAPGGIGNDIALDDITFRPCGPLLTTAFTGGSDSVGLCEGETGTFDLAAVVPPFFTSPRYQWQVSKDSGATWTDVPGANTETLSVAPTEVGAYWYRLSVGESENFSLNACRVTSSVSAVNIHPLPQVSAGADKVIINGGSTVLDGTISAPVGTYSWTPTLYLDDTALLTPAASPPSDQIYTLSAVSPYGCRAADEVFIKVISGIYIPNAFSPNGDGANDAWRIRYAEYLPEATVKIFNRYGQLMYQTSKGQPVSWDGKYNGLPQPMGTYVYLVQLEQNEAHQKGTFTLFR